MTFLHAIIIGIVEGITEFLPISSTGHIIITGTLLQIPDTNFLKSFGVIIQLGAILGVVFLYFNALINIKNIKKIIVGSIPTALIGFGLYDIIKKDLLGSTNVVLWAMLLGGLFLIIFEYFYKGPDVEEEQTYDITYKQSFIIGIFQSLAVIPGVSRSAASIIGGLSLGIPRKTIVEFSFMLAVPVMIGASSLDVYKNLEIFTKANFTILATGFITSFIVSIIAIKFLLRFIKSNNFIPFGVYRIIAAIAFYFIIF
jgi:undecaprenyl-diphosphatase